LIFLKTNRWLHYKYVKGLAHRHFQLMLGVSFRRVPWDEQANFLQSVLALMFMDHDSTSGVFRLPAAAGVYVSPNALGKVTNLAASLMTWCEGRDPAEPSEDH
jgi:hypothetical protein